MVIGKIRIVFVAAAGAAIFVVAGCGKAEDDSAPSKSWSKRSDPGFVRLINLTESPITASDRGRPIVGEVGPEEASRYIPIGVGKRTIELRTPDSQKLELDLRSGAGVNALVLSPKTTALIEDDERYTSGDKNLRVVFVDSAGKALTEGCSVKVEGPSGPVKLTPGKLTAGLGTYRAEGSGFANSADIDVEPKFAYTFLFVQAKKGYRAFLLRNADNDKPVAGAQSSS